MGKKKSSSQKGYGKWNIARRNESKKDLQKKYTLIVKNLKT